MKATSARLALLAAAALLAAVAGCREVEKETAENLLDAFGVAPETPVKMAGKKVGFVKEIEKEDRFYKTELAIFGSTKIPKDSMAKRAETDLGDAYIEIVPGKAPETMAAGATILEDNPVLKDIADGGVPDKDKKGKKGKKGKRGR